MKNLIKDKKLLIGNGYETPFANKADIYQDGTVPFCRDKTGKLWAIGGHSHMGHIGMFCGEDLTDMKEAYSVSLNFAWGMRIMPLTESLIPKASGPAAAFGRSDCIFVRRRTAFSAFP